MKKLFSILLIIICLLIQADTFSQNRNLQKSAENVTVKIKLTYPMPPGPDSFITAYMNQSHIAGVSACIIKHGEVIWRGNYGWAYANLNIPVRDSTLFQIASVSKTVTTAALMHLYETGRFGLDDSLNAYLPFTVKNPNHPNSPITFRMLLTHTSSIRDNWSFMPYYYHTDPPLALGDYLDDYFTPDSQYYSPQNFFSYAPGASYAYCNIGFALAGYLVEAITGVEISRYCRDSLFSLIDMNNSSFFFRDLDTMQMAMPYRWSSGNFIPYGHYSYHDYPAGALKTSTAQLSQFLIAIMQYGMLGNIRILDSATVRLMMTPQIPVINASQGICWYKITLGTRILWGHHGGDYGMRTGMFFCPADTTGAIVFTNGESSVDPILNELFNFAACYIISVRPVNTKIAESFKLYQNYPNPFNPATKITFDLIKSGEVKLTVLDITGREVAVLVNERLKPGSYEVEWEGSGFSSGVYFYRIESGKYTETKKMLFLK